MVHKCAQIKQSAHLPQYFSTAKCKVSVAVWWCVVQSWCTRLFAYLVCTLVCWQPNLANFIFRRLLTPASTYFWAQRGSRMLQSHNRSLWLNSVQEVQCYHFTCVLEPELLNPIHDRLISRKSHWKLIRKDNYNKIGQQYYDTILSYDLSEKDIVKWGILIEYKWQWI